MRSVVVAGLIAFAGCHDGSSARTGSWTIPIDRGNLTGGPTLLVAQDGDTWQTLDPMATEVTVHHSAFVLVAACTTTKPSSTRTLVSSDARTVDDPFALRLPCVDSTQTAQPATVTVTGQVAPAGEICDYFNGCTTDSAASWTFTWTAVHAGVPDTFIASDADHVAVLHDLVFTQNTTRPPLDLATMGQPFATFAVALDGLAPSDSVLAAETIAVHGTELTGWNSLGAPGALPIVPDALLGPDDAHEIVIDVGTNAQRRLEILSRDLSVVQSSYTILPPLVGVTFAPHTAMWSTLPAAIDTVVLTESSSTAGAVARVSLDYLAGATTVTTDYSKAPGYDPAWMFTPTSHRFGAYQTFSDAVHLVTETP